MILCPHCNQLIIRSSLHANDTIVHASGSPVGMTALCQHAMCSKKIILCCLCDNYVTKYSNRHYFLNGHIGNIHPEVRNNNIDVPDETMGDDHIMGGIIENRNIDAPEIGGDDHMMGGVIENIHDVSGFESADNGSDIDVASDEEECLSDRSEENCIAPIVSEDEDDEDEESSDDEDEEDQDDTLQRDQPCPSRNHPNEPFATMDRVFEGNFSLSVYFYHQHQTFGDICNVPGGIRGVVYRSLKRKPHSLQCENEDRSKLYFTLLLKLHGETKVDNELTLTLINELRESFFPYLNQRTLLPRLPTTMEDVNKMILTSSHSMLRNIPVAGILDRAGDDDFHALSSIERTIDIMMGQGIRPNFIQSEHGEINVEGLNGTQAANDILQDLRGVAEGMGHNPDNVAIGWISLWSGK